MPDFSHPAWWPVIALVWLAVIGMVAFPIYYWRKDKKRRRAASEEDRDRG